MTLGGWGGGYGEVGSEGEGSRGKSVGKVTYGRVGVESKLWVVEIRDNDSSGW